jgi:membrane-associated protein
LKWPNQVALNKTSDFYDKHGEKGLLFSMFLPVIRTLAPFLAGMTNMHFIKFARAASAGALIWVLTCALAGYFFGNIPLVKNHLGLITMLGLGLVILALLIKKVSGAMAKPR